MKKIIILAICSFLAAVSINFLDKQIYPLALREEIRVVPKKKIIDFLCLDNRGFVADLFSGMGLIHNFDDVKLARPILEKGMKVFPESWELPFWLGYDHYIYLEDYDVGGEYLWRASQKPNAPKRFFSLLLSVLRKGGSYERGLWVLRVMVENAKDEKLKMYTQKNSSSLKTLRFFRNRLKCSRNAKADCRSISMNW